MPLKLHPPRDGKTPYWYVRGTYVGTVVNRSTGTHDRPAAARILKLWRSQIERGEYDDPRAPAPAAQPVALTFLAAALAYMRAGGEQKHLAPLIEYAGPHALRDLAIQAIGQTAIDNFADAVYPNATPATKNRQVYTPVIAVLRRAGVVTQFRRPKGWRGKRSTSWLRPEQAFVLLDAADAIDAEFGLLCALLLYTGMRISEALAVTLRHLDLGAGSIYLPTTKNGLPRPVHLPPWMIEQLRTVPPRSARPHKQAGITLARGVSGRSQIDAGTPFLERHADARLFRFHNGGALRDFLKRAMAKAKLSFPPREGGFHLFCHTYGTWMVQFGSIDAFGLVRTKRWSDPRSADRYSHTAPSSEARLADVLPRRGPRVD